METLVVFAIVVLGAAALVALGVFLSPSGEAIQVNPAARTGKRRWPRILGGLLLAMVGGLTVLVSYANTVPVCDVRSKNSYRLESRGNAVAVTSSVLEFESPTGGLFCEDERVMRVRASARPTGRKPVLLGIGEVAATRRYLLAGTYEIAKTFMSLDDTRRFGGVAQRLPPPASKPFWRSHAISSARAAGGRARLTHDWRAVGAEPFAGPRFGTPPSERFWLVVMNADGSPGVAAGLSFEVGLAPIDKWPGRIGMLVGIGVVVAGIAVAVRRPRRTSASSGVESELRRGGRSWSR